MPPTPVQAEPRLPNSLLPLSDRVLFALTHKRGTARYSVASQSQPGNQHDVRLAEKKWTCSCAFHTASGRDCIHILAVQFQANIHAALDPVVNRPVCDRCGSPEVVQNGKRHNKSGAVVRWLCRGCGRNFTGPDGFRKRRAEPEKIALALDLYFRGLSFRKVAEHFAQVHGLPVSPVTVYRWVHHFGTLASEWMDQQAARTGARWHVDETVINVDGENHYLWNVLDGETRFLLATHISRTRSLVDTRAPLQKAKNATLDRPAQVFTDGMMAYPDAVGKELGHVGGRGSNGFVNPHHRVPSIRAKESNNRVERLHGTEKERVKVMRAFDNPDGAAGLTDGFRVHYNMVRTHQAIGKTPAEAAGLEPLTGFKWLEVLKLATAAAAGEEASAGK